MSVGPGGQQQQQPQHVDLRCIDIDSGSEPTSAHQHPHQQQQQQQRETETGGSMSDGVRRPDLNRGSPQIGGHEQQPPLNRRFQTTSAALPQQMPTTASNLGSHQPPPQTAVANHQGRGEDESATHGPPRPPGNNNNGSASSSSSGANSSLVSSLQLLIRTTKKLSLDANPSTSYLNYRRIYREFSEWVDNSLDSCRPTFEEIRFVIFVELWLRLFTAMPDKAEAFLIDFAWHHERYHSVELAEMKRSKTIAAARASMFVSQLLKGDKIVVHMDRFSMQLLMTHFAAWHNLVLVDLLQTRTQLESLPVSHEARLANVGSGGEARIRAQLLSAIRVAHSYHPHALGLDLRSIHSPSLVAPGGASLVQLSTEEILTRDQVAKLEGALGVSNFRALLPEAGSSGLVRYDGETSAVVGREPAGKYLESPTPRTWRHEVLAISKVESLLRRDTVNSETLPSVLNYKWHWRTGWNTGGGPRRHHHNGDTTAAETPDVSCVAVEETRGSLAAVAESLSNQIYVQNLQQEAWNGCKSVYREKIVKPWIRQNLGAGTQDPTGEPMIYTLEAEPSLLGLKFGRPGCLSERDNEELLSLQKSVPLKTLTFHGDLVTSFKFLPSFLTGGELTLAISGSYDSKICLWDINGQSMLAAYLATSAIVSLDSDPQFGVSFLAGQNEGASTLWRMERSHPLRILGGPDSVVSVVKFHPNGRLCAVGTRGGFVRMYDTRAATCVATLNASSRPISNLAFSKNGRLVSVSLENSLEVVTWDLQTEKLLPVINYSNVFDEATKEDSSISSLCYSHGNEVLAVTIAGPGIVDLWDPYKAGPDKLSAIEMVGQDNFTETPTGSLKGFIGRLPAVSYEHEGGGGGGLTTTTTSPSPAEQYALPVETIFNDDNILIVASLQ